MDNVRVFEEVYIAPNVVVRFDPADEEAVKLVSEALREKGIPMVETRVKAGVKVVDVEANRVYRAKLVRRSV